MSAIEEQKLARQIPKGKAVCPTCRNGDNGNQFIFINQGDTNFGSSKVYLCRHGHATKVSTFTNDMFHVVYGPGDEDFENIKGSVEDLENLVDKKAISCHHIRDNGRTCSCKLKPIDGFNLHRPHTNGIKTKTRLGDIWDKAGAEPVRSGSYDKDGNFSQSSTELINRERIKKMQKKRNTEESRQPGRRITKPTK